MKVRRQAALAFAVTTAVVVVTATPGGVFLVARNGLFEADMVAYTLGFLALSVVGGLLVARRPSNALGWVVALAGLLPIVSVFAYQYAIFGLLTSPGALPGAVFAAWLANWTFFPALGLLMVLVPVLFPTGSPPSRRWRPLAWGGGVTAALAAVSEALLPGPLGFIQEVEVVNPVGVAALGGVLEPVGGAVFGLYAVLGSAAVVSLLVRFAGAGAIERHQIKWLLYAIGIGLVAVLVSEFVIDVSSLDGTFAAEVVYLVGASALWVGPPLAIWVAVTRHRLYEIDRIVSRTVSHALVVTVLGAVYVAGVVGLGAIVRGLTGAGGGDLVVAASTLLVAAAFGPVRGRIQSVVDRRFARARYDARRTVETYTQRLRDEMQLDALDLDLCRTVSASLRPSQISLWLTARDARTS